MNNKVINNQLTKDTKLTDRILRRSKVEDRTGLPRSTLYWKIAKGEFPKPILLGGAGSRNVGWIESEVDAWIEQQILKSRGEENGGVACNR